jgi:hypothetical protein
VSALIGELAERLAQAQLPGPVLVMLGKIIGEQAYAQSAAAKRQHG